MYQSLVEDMPFCSNLVVLASFQYLMTPSSLLNSMKVSSPGLYPLLSLELEVTMEPVSFEVFEYPQ